MPCVPFIVQQPAQPSSSTHEPIHRRAYDSLTRARTHAHTQQTLPPPARDKTQLKAVPELVKTKQDIAKLTGAVQGACHDVEYALATVQQMHQIASFESLQAHTLKAIEYQHAISRSYKDSLPSRKQQREDAANVDSHLVEPVGVLSSSLRTGETPDASLSPDVTDQPNTVASAAEAGDGAVMGGASSEDGGAAGTSSHVTARVAATVGAAANADDSAPKKKKKKNKKEIIVKSF